MLGLFGVFARFDQEKIKIESGKFLKLMLSVTYPDPFNKIDTFIDKSIALGRVSLGTLNNVPQPICDDRKRFFLFMDGQIFDYAKDEQNSEERIVLNLFLQHGTDLVKYIKGVFLIIIYDSKTETLYIMNSRYGQEYLYYYIDSKVMVFASSLKAILATGLVPKRTDERAIYDFFKFEFITGDETFLKGIKLFPYASVAKITKNSSSFDRYWDYPKSNDAYKSAKANINDLIDKGSFLLKQAVARQLKPGLNPAVTLSGGLDSRAISGYLTNLGTPLFAFHVNGHGDNAETRSARAICEMLRGTWHLYNLYDCDFENTVLEGVNLGDGHISSNQFWLLDCVKRIKASDGINYVLDGFAMDILFQPLFIRRQEKPVYTIKEKVDIINKSFSTQDDEFMRNFFPKNFQDKYLEYTGSSVEDSIKQFGSDDISCLTQYFHFVNRARRFVMGMPVINRSYVEYGFPGLDYDLFDFGLSLPLEYRLKGELYRRIMMKDFPQLGRIPWAATGLPLDHYDESYIKTKRQMRRYLYYLSRLTNGRLETLPRYNLNHRFRRDNTVRNFFMEILTDDRTVERGYIDRRGIDRLITHQDSGRNYISMMQSIVTIELMHRNLIDEDVTGSRT